jgi:hypothetical protein
MFIDLLGEVFAFLWEFMLELGFEFVKELIGEWLISRLSAGAERQAPRLKGSHWPRSEAECRALAIRTTSRSGRNR